MGKYSCQGIRRIFFPFLLMVLGLTNASIAQTELDSLVKAFNNGKADFERSELIERISKIHSAESFRFLLSALNDSSLIVRVASVEALAYFGDTSAVPPLEARWSSAILPDSTSPFFGDSIYEKGFIAAALAKLGRKGYLTFVHQALTSSDKTVRYNMAYALGLAGGKDAVNTLAAILITDDAEMVCEAATSELIRILELDSDSQTAATVKNRSSFLLQQFSH